MTPLQRMQVQLPGCLQVEQLSENLDIFRFLRVKTTLPLAGL